MLPPKENPPRKPSVNDWRQRRGTSISLGSIGQSALRPNADGRPPLLSPRPTPQAQTQKPAAASPPVSRAFMSGSLVPPRPMGQRPAPQPQAPRPQAPRPQAPQAPRPDEAAARAAPQPLPTGEPIPPQRADAPSAPRAAQPAPSPEPQPKTMARPTAAPARGIVAQQPASPAPEPKPAPKAEPEVAAAATAPRRPAKTVRQFNAAVAADARGPAPARAPSVFNRRNGAIAAAALVVISGGSAGAWWMTQPKAPSVTATPVTLAPAAATAAVATTSNPEQGISTSAVTEAPSDAVPTAPTIIAERRAGPPANFGALAPRPAPGTAPTRAGRVVLAPLPDTPDLATGSSAAEPASEPAPVPAPPPVIRLPSSDEPFSTNPANPDGGG